MVPLGYLKIISFNVSLNKVHNREARFHESVEFQWKNTFKQIVFMSLSSFSPKEDNTLGLFSQCLHLCSYLYLDKLSGNKGFLHTSFLPLANRKWKYCSLQCRGL